MQNGNQWLAECAHTLYKTQQPLISELKQNPPTHTHTLAQRSGNLIIHEMCSIVH